MGPLGNNHGRIRSWGPCPHGTKVLIKKSKRHEISLIAMWGQRMQMAIWKPGRAPSLDTGSASTLILDFLTSKTVINKCLLFSAVPSLFGTRDQFHGRHFSCGLEEKGWFQDDSSALHLPCTLFLFFTSSTSDHQALDPRSWGPLLWTILAAFGWEKAGLIGSKN